MHLPSAILFLLAGIGVVNGLLLGGYLVMKQPRRPASVYFGGLLLAISIRIGKSVFIYFQGGTDRLILQIGLSACAFIGPFFFLYIRSRLREERQLKQADLVALGLLAVLVIGIGTVFPYRLFPDYWNDYFIHAIYGLWALGLVRGLYLCRSLVTIIFQQRLREFDRNDQYLLSVLLGMIFISCTYFFALYIKSFTYIWGSLIFSWVFYFLMYKELRERFNEQRSSSTKPTIDPDDLSLMLARLDLLVEQKGLHKNPKLKLSDFAEESGLKTHHLSRVLNESHHGGYANYINEKRVLEARKLIRDMDHLSLEGIGYEAGFNSKSSFFAVFRKVTGSTPAQYRKESSRS